MRIAPGLSRCLLTATLLAAPAFCRAGDFLRLDGVTGPSTGAGHVGWLDVTSYAMVVTTPANHNTASGAGAGRVGASQMSVTRPMDQASPQLMQAARTGRRFATAQLDVSLPSVNARGLSYALGGVVISNYQASNGNESFTLVYQTETQATQTPYGAHGPAPNTLHSTSPGGR